MSRRIGLMLVAIGAFTAAFATADDAEARHRRRGGSCGSWGGNGSWGSSGSHGGFFSRRHHGSHRSNGGWGSNGSHGGRYYSNNCGSHGGSYQAGGSYEVIEESAPQAASVEGGRGEMRYYGERGETFQGGRRDSRSTFDDRSMRSEGRTEVDFESRGAGERREFDSSRQRQDRQLENQGQSQDARDTGQDSNQNQNQNRNANQNESRTQNDNQQSPPPPSPPSGT
jgi:hypothetical protein